MIKLHGMKNINILMICHRFLITIFLRWCSFTTVVVDIYEMETIHFTICQMRVSSLFQ
jgi:hypothetical protein